MDYTYWELFAWEGSNFPALHVNKPAHAKLKTMRTHSFQGDQTGLLVVSLTHHYIQGLLKDDLPFPEWLNLCGVSVGQLAPPPDPDIISYWLLTSNELVLVWNQFWEPGAGALVVEKQWTGAKSGPGSRLALLEKGYYWCPHERRPLTELLQAVGSVTQRNN